MTKNFILVLVIAYLAACSAAKNPSRKKIIIPEIDLTTIEYYSEDDINKTAISVMKLTSLYGKISYPEEARKHNIQGRVIIETLISKEGKPYITSIKKGVHESLNNEAIKIIKESKFEPVNLNGKPINVLVKIPIEFRLGKLNNPNF